MGWYIICYISYIICYILSIFVFVFLFQGVASKAVVRIYQSIIYGETHFLGEKKKERLSAWQFWQKNKQQILKKDIQIFIVIKRIISIYYEPNLITKNLEIKNLKKLVYYPQVVSFLSFANDCMYTEVVHQFLGRYLYEVNSINYEWENEYIYFYYDNKRIKFFKNACIQELVDIIFNFMGIQQMQYDYDILLSNNNNYDNNDNNNNNNNNNNSNKQFIGIITYRLNVYKKLSYLCFQINLCFSFVFVVCCCFFIADF